MTRLRRPSGAALFAISVAAALSIACEDITEYRGTWEGPASSDPHLRQGFSATARLRATIGVVTRTDFEMTVWLPDAATALAFAPIRGTLADALGDLRLSGDPLRTVLGFLRPAAGDPFLTTVSIFPDDRIDVRVIRGADEIYGVFQLRRAR